MTKLALRNVGRDFDATRVLGRTEAALAAGFFGRRAAFSLVTTAGFSGSAAGAWGKAGRMRLLGKRPKVRGVAAPSLASRSPLFSGASHHHRKPSSARWSGAGSALSSTSVLKT